MNEQKFKITIPGKPQAWSRAGKSGKRYFDRQGAAKDTFAAWASGEQPETPITSPVHVNITFYFIRPKCHYGKSGAVKDSAPVFHANTPDLDNLTKFALDALNGLWWRDDRQVASVCCQKFYDTDPRTELEVIVLED